MQLVCQKQKGSNCQALIHFFGGDVVSFREGNLPMVVVSGGGGKWPLIALSPLVGDVKTLGSFNMYLSSTYINIYQHRKMDVCQHRNIHISQHNIKNHCRPTQAPTCNTQQKNANNKSFQYQRIMFWSTRPAPLTSPKHPNTTPPLVLF